MKNQNWELKYKDLKIRFIDAVDLAFRLGMEQGLQQAQVQQSQQAQASAEQAQQTQMGQDPNAEQGQEMPGQEQSDGSELDQHINQLESVLQKTEAGSLEHINFKKSLDGIRSFQHDLRQKYELKKSEKAIAAIGKAMKTPFTLGKTATKNLSEHGKKALNMQEQIVSDLMKAMGDEQVKASESITKTLSLEQILKG